MLEIKAAREIRGAVETPPSLNQYILSTVAALASQLKTTISPFPDTPAVAEWNKRIGSHCSLNQTKDTIVITPQENSESMLDFAGYHLPYRDFILFVALGMGKTVKVTAVSEKRIEYWTNLATKWGCTIKADQSESFTYISLFETENFRERIEDITFDELYSYIGCGLGLRKKVEAEIDFQFSSIIRPLTAAFGYECAVTSNQPAARKSSLERRLKMLKKKKQSENPVTSTLSVDFSHSSVEEAQVTLSGDELFAAIVLAAKSIVQRGPFIINNVLLVPWALPLLDFLRKMGFRPGIQETGLSSFGPVGMIQFQNYSLISRKIVCRPLCHYYDQLPAMIVLGAFADGQSIFRELEDMRYDIPDGIEQINECIRLLGARFGEMPDGIVIDGANQFDGFDLPTEIFAGHNAAFAVAGLKCMGTTTIADTAIKNRWPGFEELLQSICQFRT
ncbi:MAG: hypothetical protein GF401_09810 [Chitinivibrionales bacterium]|nr:hypothetical protein [Chitinivibrionales bacterium]